MTKYFSDDDAVECLARGVIDGSCPKAEWTHAAHFAVAFWVLRHWPNRPAETVLPDIIRTYNEATGVQNIDTSGYHETITLASIRAARSFIGGYPASKPLHELVDVLMDTPLGGSGWIFSHWSRERLLSVEARRVWVEPNLQPLHRAEGPPPAP
jgi:hypothetical protein